MNHSGMRYDEVIKKVSVKFNDSSETSVSLMDKAYAFGKTQAKGVKMFRAIAPRSRGINIHGFFFLLQHLSQHQRAFLDGKAAVSMVDLGIQISYIRIFRFRRAASAPLTLGRVGHGIPVFGSLNGKIFTVIA